MLIGVHLYVEPPFRRWFWWKNVYDSLQWRHNERVCVSNHQPHGCLLNRLFGRRSKKTPKLRVTGLCAGNSPGTFEFSAQMASNAENVSIWWRHHAWVKIQWSLFWGRSHKSSLIQMIARYRTRKKHYLKRRWPYSFTHMWYHAWGI